MPPSERALMAWLLSTKREVEDQIGLARASEKKLWIALFISWAFDLKMLCNTKHFCKHQEFLKPFKAFELPWQCQNKI
ncbi:unnamed protein product [Prunus armeniaca]